MRPSTIEREVQIEEQVREAENPPPPPPTPPRVLDNLSCHMKGEPNDCFHPKYFNLKERCLLLCILRNRLPVPRQFHVITACLFQQTCIVFQ